MTPKYGWTPGQTDCCVHSCFIVWDYSMVNVLCSVKIQVKHRCYCNCTLWIMVVMLHLSISHKDLSSKMVKLFPLLMSAIILKLLSTFCESLHHGMHSLHEIHRW